MNFKELDLKLSYSSDSKNSIVNDFYRPIFRIAKKYKRAVGYFNCDSLWLATQGFDAFNDDIEMKIVVSPNLSSEDLQIIEEGYEKRRLLIEQSLIKDFNEQLNSANIERVSKIVELIALNRLDIYVAVPKNSINGIYHEKYGIFYDDEDNTIAFVGSLNETFAGLTINHESFDVYISWNERDLERILNKEVEFEKLLNNSNSNLEVIEFPKAVKDNMIKIVKEYEETLRKKNNGMRIPDKIGDNKFELRDYQKEAIDAWMNNNFIGLFTMATGTGKTHTALCASVKLVERMPLDNLLTIIVCPYKHLIEQWEEDAKLYGYEIIKVHSDYEWEKLLNIRLRNLKSSVIDNLLILVSNNTFASDNFQQKIRTFTGNTLLIIDEAHNFGTEKKLNYLDDFFTYRIALSATPYRHYDDIGTTKLINYFGGEIFKYDLKDAIENGFLTEYKYFPILVTLRDDEFEKYQEITKAIAPFYNDFERGKLNDFVKMKLIERARLINLAKNKETILKKIMKDKSKTYNNIVYCGAGTNEVIDDNLKQIDSVSHLLGYGLDMKCHQFTYNESNDERKKLIKRFENSDDLQVLIAIKCLDEGVNIPSIQRAFILASSTNPKEYIQRRGRVLRKFKDKEFAEIYDFITLPKDIEEISTLSMEILDIEKSLVIKELRRLIEFANLALNKIECIRIIFEIANAYKINMEDLYDDDSN